jgi:hypothetical protein
VSRTRVVLSLLVAVLGLDLVLVLLTGSASLLSFGAPVQAPAFLWRLVGFGLVFAARFYTLAPARRRLSGARLLLALLLLPALAQFQLAGGRLGGDGIMYYVYVRSLLKDSDVDFTNEYAHYGLLTRSDLGQPTKTGLRRSIFSVGPAVAWAPFFALGELVARGQSLLTGEADLSGYGPAHRNAVALGSLLYGFAALLLIHALLLRHFSAATALLATLLVWGTTFLHWYMVQQPAMSHALSAFAAAFALWLWDAGRRGRSLLGFLAFGLVLGLAMSIRWQNGVFLLLPALELAGKLRGGQGLPAMRAGSLLALGVLAGASPQLLVWKALYGQWLLPYPPHGADFLRLDHPYILETLFSSRHGLLAWTPSLWAGFLGFIPLLSKRRGLALPLLPALLVMTYVNCCSGDWWAGGSFSNRRFDSLLPLFACGFAASVDCLRRLVAARPALLLPMLALPFALQNLTLADIVARGYVARDDTVSFSRLVGLGTRAFAERLGFPTTWPASWLFAWRHERPPAQYDRLVGRYLFYRQNNLGGRIGVANPDHEALLGEGFGPITAIAEVPARAVRGRARLFAPLDVPEDLELRLALIAPEGPAAVAVDVNGCRLGRVPADARWAEERLFAPSACWRRELNHVWLTSDAPVFVSRADFARLPRAAGR